MDLRFLQTCWAQVSERVNAHHYVISPRPKDVATLPRATFGIFLTYSGQTFVFCAIPYNHTVLWQPVSK